LILRDLYFGTRGGHLFASADEGESWRSIADGCRGAMRESRGGRLGCRDAFSYSICAPSMGGDNEIVEISLPTRVRMTVGERS